MAPDDNPTAPDEFGFTAEERAAFDGNREATQDTPVAATPSEAPATPEPAAVTPPPAAVDPAAAAVDPAASAAPQDGVPGPDDDEDDDDVVPPGIDPKTGKTFRKRVNYNKYRRMAERAQLAEGKANELAANMARMDERLKIFTDVLQETPQQQQAAADADPEPNPQEDLFAYLAWQRRQIGRMEQDLKTRETRETQTTEVQKAERDFRGAYIADTKRFLVTKPNFPQAYRHLIDTRERQLRALGHEDPSEIESIVQREERSLALQAYQRGQNPADVLYRAAVAYGYSEPVAGQAAAAAPAANGGAPVAQSAANGAVVPAKVDVAAQIAAVKTALPAGQSLSGGAGGAAPQVLDRTHLADLPQAEFDRVYDSLTPEQQRAIMGGA